MADVSIMGILQGLFLGGDHPRRVCRMIGDNSIIKLSTLVALRGGPLALPYEDLTTTEIVGNMSFGRISSTRVAPTSWSNVPHVCATTVLTGRMPRRALFVGIGFGEDC